MVDESRIFACEAAPKVREYPLRTSFEDHDRMIAPPIDFLFQMSKPLFTH